MKSPVVPFRDPAAAAKERAKLSQEGSCIPIFINISTRRKYRDFRTQNKHGEREPKKSLRASMAGF
jgi:hypothetical protein